MWAGREELGDDSKGGIAVHDLPRAGSAPVPAASKDNAPNEDF